MTIDHEGMVPGSSVVTSDSTVRFENKLEKGSMGLWEKFCQRQTPTIALPSRRFVAVVLQPRWHRSVGSDKCMNPSLLLADDSSSGSEERGLWHYLPASTLRSYKKTRRTDQFAILYLEYQRTLKGSRCGFSTTFDRKTYYTTAEVGPW
jgi:hypothetical protein